MHRNSGVDLKASVYSKVLLFVLGLSILHVSSVGFARDTSICNQLLSPAAAPFNEQDLRVLTYNLKAFSVKSAQKQNKRENNRYGMARIEEIGKVIKSLNADIMNLQEVSSLEDLRYINENFLNNEYNVYYFAGNTSGTGLGFLVRRSLPLSVETQSFSDTLWVDPVDRQQKKVFTRDAPALMFKNRKGQFVLTVMGVHLKSMKSRNGDEQSRILRSAETKAVAEIVADLSEFTNAPVLLAGDFNCDIARCPENDVLKEVLHDSFDLSPRKTQASERSTFVYFQSKSRSGGIANQLDAILVTKSQQLKVLQVTIHTYTSTRSKLPLDPDDRDDRPSDHLPVYSDIRIAI